MSNHKLYFISGLPRSGSTLLCNILAQNPKMHTTSTSACHETLFVIRNNWYEWVEHKASKRLSDEKNLQRVLNSILQSYHDTERPIVFDKGRGWISVMEMLEFALGQRPKILVPVRNMSQIVSSFEKLHRKNAHSRSPNGEFAKSQTIRGRSEELLAENGIIGLSHNRLKNAIEVGWSDCLHLVEFDNLTNNPQKTIDEIYNFLGEDKFNHDFDNVKQYTHEDDSAHGFNDLHTIRPQVKPVTDDSVEILGEELTNGLINTEFWRK